MRRNRVKIKLKMLLFGLIAVLALATSALGGGFKVFYQHFGDPMRVPEPVALVLLGSALASFGLAGRRRLHRD